MKKLSKITLTTVAIAAITILALGALTFSTSYAQSDTVDGDSVSAGIGERLRNMAQKFKNRRFGPRNGGRGHGKGMGQQAELVAGALGITVDELKAAREEGKSIADLQAELGVDAETFQANLKAAAIAQVNQKLADEEITQEKADAWIEKIESSEFNMNRRGHGRGHRGHGKGMGNQGEIVAEALGITVDELKAARQEGKSLADLQAELGVDAETFQVNLKTAAIAQINQKLADGDITQEKADAWIEKIENAEFNMGGRGFGRGHGKGQGWGDRNHGQDDDGAEDAEPGNTEESDTDGDENEDEQSADASGGDTLFRLTTSGQSGEMSLYLPMVSGSN